MIQLFAEQRLTEKNPREARRAALRVFELEKKSDSMSAQNQTKDKEEHGEAAVVEEQKGGAAGSSAGEVESPGDVDESPGDVDAPCSAEAPHKGITIFEALAASGLRSIRYFQEIKVGSSAALEYSRLLGVSHLCACMRACVCMWIRA